MFRELDVGQSALLTDIAMCINYYRLFSPGLYCCVHATVQLDDDTRFCPGIIVQVNHGQFKQCEPDDCFKGPPNFVLDVFPETTCSTTNTDANVMNVLMSDRVRRRAAHGAG